MNSNIAVVIAAAGSSTRMGSIIKNVEKKEYLPLNGGTVLSESVRKFLEVLPDAVFFVIVPAGGIDKAKSIILSDCRLVQNFPQVKSIEFVEGGNTRQKSVFNALNAISTKKGKIDYVLIHDGARPFVSEEIISSTLDACIRYGAAVPGVTPVDTQKLLDEGGFISVHLTRRMMTAVQTPQGFEFSRLFEAHKKAIEETIEYTDDTEIWGKYCGKVKVVQGSVDNKKITYPKDYQVDITSIQPN